MKIAYIRVSTFEQNEARQQEALQGYNIEKWFSEKVSGKDMNRPELQALLEFVREGDTVFVMEFSRLARSTEDLLQLVDLFNSKNVQLVSLKENIDSATPQGRLMLTMIAAINQFERECILERQREGIEIAKRAGKYKGGQEKKINRADFEKYYSCYLKREITKGQLAEKLKISRPTLDKFLKNNGLLPAAS